MMFSILTNVERGEEGCCDKSSKLNSLENSTEVTDKLYLHIPFGYLPFN